MKSPYDRKGGSAEGEKQTAFISYSRKDIDFVNRLQDGLKACGIDAHVDRKDIEKGEEWWARIKQLIAEADSVIFVLSPDSAVSPICQNEVDFAEGLKKRLIPIVVRDLAGQQVPAALARLNWIFFAATPSAGASGDFNEATGELVRALETNIKWICEHTRLGQLARRWEANGRRHEFELRGGELSAAETWLTTRPKNAPDPTDTDRVFITQSRRAATIRQRRIVAVLVSVVIAALTLSGIAIWQWRTAVWQFVQTDQAKKDAVAQRDRAVQMESVASNANDKAQANLRDAQVEQSLFLADQARQQRDGDPILAVLLAVEALPDGDLGVN